MHRSGNKPREAQVLRQLGIRYMDQGSFKKANEYLHNAFNQYLSLVDSANSALVLLNLGALSYYQNEYAEAIQHWKSAFLHYKSHLGPDRQLALYGNLGAAYSEVNRPDSTRFFQQAALSLAMTLGDRSAMASAYQNLGETAEHTGRLDEALKYYQQAQSLQDSLQNYNGLVRSYLSMAFLLETYRRYPEALEMNQKALVLIPQTGNNSHYRIAYLNLANVSYKLGNYRDAYNYLVQHQAEKDSLHTNQTAETLQKLENRHAELVSDHEQRYEKLKNRVENLLVQRFVLIVLFIIALSALGLIIAFGKGILPGFIRAWLGFLLPPHDEKQKLKN